MIIGISGKIGSGKDTVGKIIQYLHSKKSMNLTTLDTEREFEEFLINCRTSDWQIKKFAAKLKQVCSLLTGIPVEDFEKQEVKDKLLGEEWLFSEDTKDGGVKYNHPTVRWLLQTVGTEAMREKVHTNVWVNALFADYKLRYGKEIKPNGNTIDDFERKYFFGELPNWIITDLRFPNELEAIENMNGITIRINRLLVGVGSVSEHPSETSLDNAEFDYIINNDGTIEELIERVKEILIKEKIINENY